MYNNGNSSKNVTGTSVVDGSLESADFADDGLSGNKVHGGTISGLDGILFGTDTAAANTFNDYEKGYWDAIIKDNGNYLATMNASFTTCKYVKIGDVVHVQGLFKSTDKGAMVGTSELRVGGLPFPIGADSDFSERVFTAVLADGVTHTATLGFIGVGGESEVRLYKTVTDAESVTVLVNETAAVFSSYISFSYTI
jgi:hypothetical protein